MPRWAVLVWGTVQGVGFRPHVFEVARRLGLTGYVQNRQSDVLIEVQGESPALDRFLHDLTADLPPLARVDHVEWAPRPPRLETEFAIWPSAERELACARPAGAAAAVLPSVAPDAATCDACLAELFDPADRRYRYPFLNCTDCGPRLTIVRSVPYDRERTTMAAFAMCQDCRREYDDPRDRRFHAQPTACPACGPRLVWLDAAGRELAAADPVAAAVAELHRGRIVAVKGLGGYHLACDATNEAAVAELRRRKGRDEKPLAVMVADPADAEALCELSPAERELLRSRRRPIVLLRRRDGGVGGQGATMAPSIAPSVAPRATHLGLMLPYTPLHHLLLHEFALVMTSGNRADEPISFRDEEALRQLAGVADFYLTHNRPIQVRCDDSVTRAVAGEELPVRRSRGYAPELIELPITCPRPILALGGHAKATFALGRGRQAVISHHLGDLEHYEAYRAYTEAIDHYQALFDIQPELLVHDLHPDYASTNYAVERERADHTRRLAVQHHHAHLASCLAEHGLTAPAIGVIFDGTGWGTDEAIWGGEFLIGDYAGFRRAAHLRYVPLPGGERAIREPWRCAAAHLIDAGEHLDLLSRRVPAAALAAVRSMIGQHSRTPPTSSMGRLFDAVAVLAGLRERVSYDGQAAVELEALAVQTPADGHGYPFDLVISSDAPKREREIIEIDTRPLVRSVASDARNGCPAERIARRFQTTIADVVSEVCGRLRETTGLEAVALSGGVFMNALLLEESCDRLAAAGFCVYRHRRVPPNDGGLSLGQLAIAAAWAARVA